MAVISSQLAFYGVRRLKAGVSASDPAPSPFKYYEKPFEIPYSFTLANVYNPAVGLLAQPMTKQQIVINNYDFELRQIRKATLDTTGPVAITSPFAMWLYDSALVQRSNLPVLAELLCDDPKFIPGLHQVWPCPPILYRVNSYITFDVFSLVPPGTANLPLTVKLMFRGVRRIPCQ